MKKSALSILLALTLCIGMGMPAIASGPVHENAITDVSSTSHALFFVPEQEEPSAWAAELVNAAIAANVVPQALQSKYIQATTRAEFCALAVAFYEKVTGTQITERMQFNDTSDVNVQKMGAVGVVAGTGNGNFSPDQKLTREQAATMLSRLANIIDHPMPDLAPTFADNANISEWAVDAVGHVQAAGIMSGVGNNTFSPLADYTREQSIITIMRMFDFVK